MKGKRGTLYSAILDLSDDDYHNLLKFIDSVVHEPINIKMTLCDDEGNDLPDRDLLGDTLKTVLIQVATAVENRENKKQ